MTQRQEIIERLNGLELKGGSHEMLSAICKAVLPHGDAWTLRRCWDLRDRLVRLLGEADAAPCGGRITDELRREAQGHLRYVYTTEHAKHLLAIADRIDAAHKEAIQHEHKTAYDAGYQNGENAILAVFDKRGNADVDETMAEHGWYRALDADKQPIHLGDEVYQVEGGWVYTVESIRFYHDNTTVTFSCKYGFGCDSAHNVRHYHAPTVEDLLRDMHAKLDEVTALYVGEAIDSDERDSDEARIFAECAAKLRLAGDAE